MSDTKDFIFCPFCGAVDWMVDKSRNTPNGRLDNYLCAGCKNFSYVNVVVGNISKMHQVIADVQPYRIRVFYFTNETSFFNLKDMKEILNIKLVIPFNWYKKEELLEKIKTYVVFS